MHFEIFWLLLFVCCVFADDLLSYPPLPPLEEPYGVPTTPKYDYAEVLHKSYLFYQAQKSGVLPYQRLAWRSDSCKLCVGDFGEDLSHAWYESASTMKWGLPLGWATTQLAFNVMVFEESMNSVNELAESLELLRWGADYFVNTHYNDTHIVGQFGAINFMSAAKGTKLDIDYWGPPEEYESWVSTGNPYKATYITPEDPATEIVGEYSAALASVSIVWRQHDPAYADTLLNHAKRLYQFASNYRASYMASESDFQWMAQWYPSNGYFDELAWSAAWLYAATQDDFYLIEARRWYIAAENSWLEYSWDDKGGGLHVLLYMLTRDPMFYENAMRYFDQYLPGPDKTAESTPRGLSFMEHSDPVGYLGNSAFLMLTFSKVIGYEQPQANRLTSFAIQQVNYALGDYGYSWVVGFGDRYDDKPYHKSSYNSYIDYPMRGKPQNEIQQDFVQPKTEQRFVLYGALESGPNPDDSWHDDRTNSGSSRVSQDFNAAWTGAIVGLIDYYGAYNFEPFTDCGLDLGWAHPNASPPPAWPEDDCYHTCNKGCSRGDMKSSYTWKLLLASNEQLPHYLNVIYPGEGEWRAEDIQGRLVAKVDLTETEQKKPHRGAIIGTSNAAYRDHIPTLAILLISILVYLA